MQHPAQDLGQVARRLHPLWLLVLFLAFGFLIAMFVSSLSGPNSDGVLLAAVGILVAIPGVVLLLKAFPQGLEKARMLSKNWTWWHLLWFLTYFSTLVFRIRDVSEAKGNPLDAWALTRVLPEAFVSLALIVRLVLRRPNWLRSLFTGIPGLMSIYCLVCLVSSLWSVNASWTAYKSLEFLADVSLIAAIVASAEGSQTYQNLLDWTLAFYGFSLVGVWINVPLFPVDAWDGGRLSGVVPVEASNSIGTYGGVLALVAICRLWPMEGKARSRAWYIFVFILGMVSMVLSQTRNAEAAFALGLLLIALFMPRVRRIAVVGALAGLPLLAAFMLLAHNLWEKAGQLVLTFAERDQSAGALDSLSGRTAWWAYGMEQLSQHPWTGLGAYAAGRFAVLGKLGVGYAAMMHSDWIEVLIGTSFWGVIPFLGALLAAWWFLIQCVRSTSYTAAQRQLAVECLALLGMLTVHSFFNDELSWHCPLLYFAILGYAEFARTQARAEAEYDHLRQPANHFANSFAVSLNRSSL